ncbi:MAG: Rpn family recombination-promoting nuclease/putative transposase [Desulfobacterales bacterium]|nr:Rpn family recombination-promoting nuclease/putative transposase [Desulfobacterales bacterium]
MDKLSSYIPDFEFILYDLGQYADDQIKVTIMARVTILLLKHIFEPDITVFLRPGVLNSLALGGLQRLFYR